MQYVLIDSHQRFLGTMDSDRRLALGDVFQRENTHTYTVIGVNQAQQRDMGFPSLTVLRMQPAKVVAAPTGLVDVPV